MEKCVFKNHKIKSKKIPFKIKRRNYTIVKAFGTFLSTFFLTRIIVDEGIEKSAFLESFLSSVSPIIVASKTSCKFVTVLSNTPVNVSNYDFINILIQFISYYPGDKSAPMQ